MSFIRLKRSQGRPRSNGVYWSIEPRRGTSAFDRFHLMFGQDVLETMGWDVGTRIELHVGCYQDAGIFYVCECADSDALKIHRESPDAKRLRIGRAMDLWQLPSGLPYRRTMPMAMWERTEIDGRPALRLQMHGKEAEALRAAQEAAAKREATCNRKTVRKITTCVS